MGDSSLDTKLQQRLDAAVEAARGDTGAETARDAGARGEAIAPDLAKVLTGDGSPSEKAAAVLADADKTSGEGASGSESAPETVCEGLETRTLGLARDIRLLAEGMFPVRKELQRESIQWQGPIQDILRDELIPNVTEPEENVAAGRLEHALRPPSLSPEEFLELFEEQKGNFRVGRFFKKKKKRNALAAIESLATSARDTIHNLEENMLPLERSLERYRAEYNAILDDAARLRERLPKRGGPASLPPDVAGELKTLLEESLLTGYRDWAHAKRDQGQGTGASHELTMGGINEEVHRIFVQVQSRPRD